MSEDQALAQLREILARPEFQSKTSLPWWQQLLAPVIDFAWTQFSRLLQLILDSTSGREGPVGLTAVLVAVILVTLVGVYLVRAVRLSTVRDAQLHRASLAERHQRSDQLWQSGQQSAAAGDLAQAVRLLYLSALYALDEHALLHVETNLTNREHALRLARAHPALGDTFTDLVDRYERVRYGSASVAADGFAEFRGRAERVRSAALEGAA